MSAPPRSRERTLRENFFPPFERAVRSLPIRAVMASYNEIDGVPSHANRWLLHDVLRGEWGYQGAVVSDYFAIRELMTPAPACSTNIADAAVRGAERRRRHGDARTARPICTLPELLRAGRIAQAQIDDAVRRILTMKFEAGLFEHPYVDAADGRRADRDSGRRRAGARGGAAGDRAAARTRTARCRSMPRSIQPPGGDRHPCPRHADRRL